MATNGRITAAPPSGLTPGSRPGVAEGMSGGSRPNAMPPSSGRSRSSRSGGSGSSRGGQRPPPPPSSSRSQHPSAGQRRPSSGSSAAIAASSSDTTEANRLKQQTPFICNIRFKNDLPEVPGHPKLLISRLNEEEASKFKLSSLEKQLRRGLLLPSDLGITISPLDINRFSVPPGERQPLDPEDEELLADDAGAGPEARPAATKQELSWLMRTTYIANESDRTRPSDKRAAEQLAAPSGQDQDQDQEMDRDAQIWAIEAGFEAAKRFDANPVNPKNPNLRPVSILPVLPDMDLWGWDFAFAKFDTDPFEDYSQLNKQEAKKKSWLKAQSVLKVFQAGEEKIIALIIPKEFPEDLPDLPSEAHKGLLSGSAEGPKWHQGDWRWLREYSFELHAKRGRGKQKRSKTSEVLLFQDDKVTYLDLPVSLTLNKRRRLDKQDEMMDIKSKRRAQVLLEDRELTEAEQLAHQGKVDALYGMQMEPHPDGEVA